LSCVAARLEMSEEGSSSSVTSVPTLYPPCMVPRSWIASSRETMEDVSAPVAMAERKAALTYAASSTPGGTRWDRISMRRSPSAAVDDDEDESKALISSMSD